MDYTASVSKIPKKGETVLSDSCAVFCGGKGANQAVAAAKLGGTVAMIGRLGKDESGQILKQNLQKYDINTTHVLEKEGNSAMAFIWVHGGDNRIVVSSEANQKFEKYEIDEALKDANKGDILVAQCEIPPAIIEYAFCLAKQKQMTTILNPAPAIDLSSLIYKKTDLIVPNETETALLTNVNPIDIVHVALAVKKFYEFGVKKVVISLGKRGLIFAEGQNITELPANKIKAIDTTAAGDTIVGAIAAKLSMGESLQKACEFAKKAAEITITRKGASNSIPYLNEIV